MTSPHPTYKQQELKEKICKYCKKPFKPLKKLQSVCSYVCAINYSSERTAERVRRKIKAENKVKLQGLKKKSEHLNELQEIFNKFIRLRDKDLPCISCGTTKKGIIYSAGHYQTVGGHANLRFNEDNCWKQCLFYCNKSQHGNLIPYRIELVKRIGIERVEALESNLAKPLKLSIHEIEELKSHYRSKIKELEKSPHLCI